MNLSRHAETRFIILMFLYNEPTHQLLPSELSQKLGSTRATTTKVINGLERNKWVVKESSSLDERSVIVRLTAEGIDLLEDFLPENELPGRHLDYVLIG